MVTPIRRTGLAGGLEFVVFIASSGAIAAQSDGAFQRLRTPDAEVRRAVALGQHRSETFRSLIDAIENSHAVVFVARDPDLPRHLEGCVVLRVGGGGTDRYLRVYIKPDLRTDRMIAVIGHELQHVLEILEADGERASPLVPRGSSMVGVGQWETEAATNAGQRIAAELRQSSGTFRPQ